MTSFETELASVRTALAVAVAEKGEDHIYKPPLVRVHDDASDEWWLEEAETCVYVEHVVDGEGTMTDELVPSCLWGHVLVTLGVPAEALDGCVAMISGPELGQTLPWSDPRITKAAWQSQMCQDTGGPWGLAVAKFESALQIEGVDL